MRASSAHGLVLAALAGALGIASARDARASNPLEYPDNGTPSFSRAGAWLGVANEPIATHYNPAALATQASGFSIEQQLNFPKTCYDRRGPNNSIIGPNATATYLNAQGQPDGEARIYMPVCNSRGGFPNTIPSISIAWRASKKLGLGFAVVPPATWGTADGQWPMLAKGYNRNTHQYEMMPAPYRYMQVSQLSTIIYPTLGFGYELFDHFRVGAAFVSGMAFINTQLFGVAQITSQDAQGDHMADDSLTTLRTNDLFVPGAIVSLHWSVLPNLDVAAWGRYMDAIQTSSAYFDAETQYFDPSTALPAKNQPANTYSNALTKFRYPIPPEARIGVRFHQPRSKARMAFADGGEVRDPLHDDLFDVEVDGSYTWNSKASDIQARFKDDGKGAGAIFTAPTNVPLPPNADRSLGYKDSVGIRVGGQWNAVPDKLGLRGGFWYESQSQDPAYLTVQVVGAERWGFAGGIVFRQDFVDLSFGYQRQLSAGLDNGGNGKSLAAVGTGGNPPFNLGPDEGKSAAARTQFRTQHAINGGHLTFEAHVFSLGATMHF
jgi:long-chain fatty acid transport protein